MKPVLLLIPGMLNTAEVWAEVAPRLAARAEVRIADVQTQDSIAAMAHDAWSRVADVPPRVPVALCGFSMGGYVALEMLARPARDVAALGLLGTSARPESPEGRAVREKTIAAIGRDFDKVVAGVAQFATDPARHADAAWMSALQSQLRAVGPETAIRQNRAIAARADHRGLLPALRLPTLVMCGRSDRVTPPALSQELAAAIPGARLAWIEDAGHMAPLEQPARVAALLGEMLDAIEGDTAP